MRFKGTCRTRVGIRGISNRPVRDYGYEDIFHERGLLHEVHGHNHSTVCSSNGSLIYTADEVRSNWRTAQPRNYLRTTAMV